VIWSTHVSDFMPHGMCLLWRPDLMALHIVSDAVIAASYFAIPFGIAWFVRRRADLNAQHKALALLFAVFIAACGATHVMSILVLWTPLYVSEGLLKAATAVVSAVSAVALVFLLPQILRIPSPRALAAEIEAHKATLAELQAAREQLAAKVDLREEELRETTRRFETALRDSPVTVFEQDEDLRYCWVYNPPMGIDPAQAIGKSESDLFHHGSAAAARSLKLAALKEGVVKQGEVFMQRNDAAGWFDMRVEPVTLRNGRPGIVATSIDITPLKSQQDHLHVVMRELNHRAKNLLAVVLSIARQTARGLDLPKAFMEQLQDRLTSLAGAHDVLARQNWSGADLRSIVEVQLSHQLKAFAGRISIEGPAFDLPPEAAHYVGMALHELGSNAVKYGALSGERGTVAVAWTLGGGIGAPELVLTWTETVDQPLSPPVHEGFGSRLLKTLAPRAVGGQADLEFLETGVCWRLRSTLTHQPSAVAL
jgi:two-component sensor histidine kinase